MIKKLYFILAAVLFTVTVSAQKNDSIQALKDEAKKGVRDPWNSNLLIDQQTATLPVKGTTEFIIQHRFTNFANGRKDLYGLYGSSNIRLAVQYGLSDRIMVGYGLTKLNMTSEFLLKIKLLEQNRGGSMPLSVYFNGNIAVNGKDVTIYGTDYKFADRLSYFSQLIISRKFTDAFSMQAACSYSYFNKVDGVKTVTKPNDSTTVTAYLPKYQNGGLGVSVGAKMHIHNAFSLIAAYDQGFLLKDQEVQQDKPFPNTAFGFEINTNTHCFQMFASTFNGLLPQQNFIKNGASNDFHYLKDFMLGFNITVRF